MKAFTKEQTQYMTTVCKEAANAIPEGVTPRSPESAIHAANLITAHMIALGIIGNACGLRAMEMDSFFHQFAKLFMTTGYLKGESLLSDTPTPSTGVHVEKEIFSALGLK